jgi:hypothetical protein
MSGDTEVIPNEAPNWYRCPCGCGWVREDKAHLIAHLISSGYGLGGSAGLKE